MKAPTQNQYYQATLNTPLGEMLAISDDAHLYLLEFYDRKNIDRQIKALGISTICNQRSAPLDMIEKELALYFDGQLKQFKTPIAFIGSDFQQQVWRALQHIPFGETRSYLDLSLHIGKPSAFRAVANANAANRFAIVVPCHRVINSTGALGGYAGGLDRKIFLINHEGVYNENNA